MSLHSLIKKYEKVIIFAIVCLFCFILLLILFKTNGKNKKEKIMNINNGTTIYLNGDFVVYTEVGEEYEELGAVFYNENGDDDTDLINISYFNDGNQYFKVDTRVPATYIVRYKALGNEVSRVVIVNDSEPPEFEDIPTLTLTADEASSFNVSDGVKVTDNSGKASVKCENTLKDNPGEYVIVCKAVDGSGNESIRKRLIKVN